MKKIIISVFSESLYYALIAALAFASYAGSHSLLNVAAMAYWVVIMLGLFVSALYISMAYALENSKNAENRQKTIDALTRYSKKKNIFHRYLSWLLLALIVCLLAYGGWVFTAVCYSLTSFFCRLCVSLVRDKLDKISKPELVQQCEGMDGCRDIKI